MRRYLTGIDWIVNSIDYSGKAQSGIGNFSEIVLELKNPPKLKILEDLLNDFIKKYPVLNGCPSRGLNLCPYWKIFPAKKFLPVWVRAAEVDGVGLQYLGPLSAQVNLPFNSKREHLSFTLVSTPDRTFLGMAFDHRLLDAKGAEALLNLFQQYYDNRKPPAISLACPHHLDNWLSKFLAGRKINRFLLKLTKEKPRTLPFNPKQEPAKFKVIQLNPVQTERLVNTAYSRAGYLMFMPYALARTIQIMHKVFQEKNICNPAYFIPVPMDMRTKEEAQKEALFNHFSFFIFKICAGQVDNLDQLLTEIKSQMYEQVKDKIPEAIINGSFLMRIASEIF
jgi:hypothetical protein